MSTVQEILTAMDKLTPDELRVVKLGVDSRLEDEDDDPALRTALHEAIAYADYVAVNGEAGAREAGKFRLEGKDYEVADGDVLHFRFAN